MPASIPAEGMAIWLPVPSGHFLRVYKKQFLKARALYGLILPISSGPTYLRLLLHTLASILSDGTLSAKAVWARLLSHTGLERTRCRVQGEELQDQKKKDNGRNKKV